MSKFYNHHDDNDRAKKQDQPKEPAGQNETTHDLLDHPSAEALVSQLSETEQKMNQLKERILYMEADHKNIQRRHQKALDDAYKYALDKFVAELIPIIDSLELCILNESKDADNVHTAVQGVQMTLSMFYTAMEKFGIKQVNPLNDAFNPEFEQAISVQEDPSKPAGTVLQVLQKGYTLNNRLIRPALVVVSK